MAGPDWRALRARLPWCVTATIVMLLFLAVWQFAVPASPRYSPNGSVDLMVWFFVPAVALSFPNAVVLAFSASRLLWRVRRRGTFWIPVPLLVVAMVGVPMLTEFSGLGRLVALWSFPVALFASAAASAYVILFTPGPTGAGPAPPGAGPAPTGAGPAPPADVDDEGHAYVRDLANPPTQGKGGQGQ